jgi:hypothetical protein
MMELRWEKMTARYSWGWEGYLGSFIVAEVTQPVQSKGYTGPRWHPEVKLPGLTVKRGLLKETEDEAKAVAQSVVNNWFKRVAALDELRKPVDEVRE